MKNQDSGPGLPYWDKGPTKPARCSHHKSSGFGPREAVFCTRQAVVPRAATSWPKLVHYAVRYPA